MLNRLNPAVVMDNMDKLISTSLDNYFTRLSSFGYNNYQSTKQLLVLASIGYIYDNFSDLITEEDLLLLKDALLCVSENCMIDLESTACEESDIFSKHENEGYGLDFFYKKQCDIKSYV